ncbi:hypothetical protein D0864_12644 [Hortaea werneckii]|uniref:Swi5-dependent recombination DNA repair protein 1 n=1 Tax=Hortaea werneckii TaxID=91943 RepID=A0A3M7DGF5_HORWE|nr:hypothetical protein KC352_g12766 [Hortaea werneckii]KAI7567377.1 hypothetical protein KC317_g5023 [Hortaea werneckii]KAI7616280.1 hypothetical protein KC346_g6078 [Hortaea werneckii]KAI7662226.1 hypothetical protein KC319_g8171 [Hortaea werneckii]KAI7694372.1 hypothetical protein KC322_g10427 [Hortaea werneckii]
MSSPLSVKRRKFNDANKTLKKPFVSPLRNASAQRPPVKEDHQPGNAPYTPSTLAHTVTAAERDTTQKNNSTASNSNPATPAALTKSQSLHKRPGFTTSSRRADPAELAAQKALTSLELQIRTLRTDIDALKQSNQISTSNTDAELEQLTEKWRLASQQASEELFGHVKERVCRMGGVAAWRESEKQKFERSHGMGAFAPEPEESDDADCEFDSQGEELPEKEQEFRKAEKRRVKQEALDAADLPSAMEQQMGGSKGGKKMVWQEDVKDDDSFTMDMMLRSLNIELDVIGYDKSAQRWT